MVLLRRLSAVLACVLLAACRADPTVAEATALAQFMNRPDGAKVADIGAGDGHFTAELSKRIGRGVVIVATELGRANVLQLWKNTGKAGAGNVSVKEGATGDTNLPAGSCDAIVLRRTYHHLMRPDEMAASLFRTLRPGGRLFIIEQPLVRLEAVPRDVPARRGGDGINPAVLIAELSAVGFRHERTVSPFSDQLYLVVLHKADVANGSR